MIFGCTRHSSKKFVSVLMGTITRPGRILKKSPQPLNILNKGCTSTIQASVIVFDLHFLCTICRICYKVLYYGNRTVQWRCPSALLPSGTGNRNVSYIFSLWQSSSKLAMLIVYRKYSKSSLLYINQCLKFGSKVTPF